MRNLSFRLRLSLLVSVFLIGLATMYWMSESLRDKVAVNGTLYKRIEQSKDLIADILPPPEFIIESYLTVLQMEDEQDPQQLQALADRFRQLQGEYATRHEFWLKDLDGGEIKKTLVDQSYAPAMRFYDLVNRDVIPKLLAPMPDRESVTTAIRGPVKQQYQLHRAQIDKVVELSNARVAENEKLAVTTIQSGVWYKNAVAALLTIATLSIGWFIGRGITRPTNILVTRMRDMAEGAADLTARAEVTSQDEIGQLAKWINQTIQKIHDLVVRVRRSTIDLLATSKEIAATADQQAGAMQGFGASSNQIAAAVKEIAATSQELLNTVQDVNDRTRQTSVLADSGRSRLSSMQDTMQQLSEATRSISSKLGLIREKAGGINVVVETITKVADQTNLLSINAAIEAEKAGEYGRGFAVVAREIRRLADQTAVATLDIEDMVRHMQAAVSAGVMEMDKFTEEVRGGIQHVGGINTELAQIIEQVHLLSDRFRTVTEGMQHQNDGAKQISDAMVELSASASQINFSLKDFKSAAGNLRQSMEALQHEFSQFTVEG